MAINVEPKERILIDLVKNIIIKTMEETLDEYCELKGVIAKAREDGSDYEIQYHFDSEFIYETMNISVDNNKIGDSGFEARLVQDIKNELEWRGVAI